MENWAEKSRRAVQSCTTRQRLILFSYSELAREKMWSRIHLIPLLTAEEDRDLVRRHLADQAREKDLMGSTTSPYNSDRYVYVIIMLRLLYMRTDFDADMFVQLLRSLLFSDQSK